MVSPRALPPGDAGLRRHRRAALALAPALGLLALGGLGACGPGTPDSTMPPPSARAKAERPPAGPGRAPGAAEAAPGATPATGEGPGAARGEDATDPEGGQETEGQGGKQEPAPDDARETDQGAPTPAVAPAVDFVIETPPLPEAPTPPPARVAKPPDPTRTEALRHQLEAIRCAQRGGASAAELSRIWRSGASDTTTWAADVRRVLADIARDPAGDLARAWQDAATSDCAASARPEPAGEVKP